MQIQTSQITNLSTFISGQGPHRESVGDEAGFTSALATVVSESEPGETDHPSKDALGDVQLSDAEAFTDPQVACGFDAAAFGSLKLPQLIPAAPTAVLFENPTGKVLPPTGNNVPLGAIGKDPTTFSAAASLGLTVSPTFVSTPSGLGELQLTPPAGAGNGPATIRGGAELAVAPGPVASLATLDLKEPGSSRATVNALDGSASPTELQSDELHLRISPITKAPGIRLTDGLPLSNAAAAGTIQQVPPPALSVGSGGSRTTDLQRRRGVERP